ncbi:MAG TPA: M56 family metallopeptidase [Verrucomicrobiae bacterium]|nr:M56 family metallopeptidase [Verrucomicrobiae bacterium]
MSFIAFAGGLMPLAALAGLVIGTVSVALLHALLRVGLFRRQASARFTLWFASLVALTCSAPAVFLGGSLWLGRVPTVPVSSLAGPPVAAVAAKATAAISVGHAGMSTATVIALVWLAGFLLSLLRLGVGMLRLGHIRRRAEAIELRAGPRGSVRVMASDHFTMPVALGYRRPVILVPRAMLALERETDFENVVLHELEHLRRFDDVTSLVQAACTSLLWFNPFAYAIGARIGIEREMACDEAVVACTGRRAGYAATLWKIAVAASDEIAPAFTCAFSSGPHTEPRLNNLLVTRAGFAATSRKPVLIAALLTFAFVGTAALAPAMVVRSAPIQAFTSLRLPDGTTLVIGGRRAGDEQYRDVQVYDAQGRRTAIVTMPLPRWSAIATLRSDGQILIKGGENATGALRCKLLYDPRTHRLTET